MFIPDAVAGSAELIRAKWNPATGKFEYVDQLTVMDGDLRPNAASAGPDNNIYLSFARARSIVKITRPTTNQPSIEQIASVNSAALGLSATTFNSQGRVTVFVAEAAGLTTFTAPSDGSLTDYVPLAAYNVGKPTRVYFDSATKMLYTGTSGGTSAANAGMDTIARINLQTGVVESQWALGFSMVSGLGMKAGKLLVMDDAGQLEANKPAGQGKLYLLSNTAAQILTGPTAADGTQAANPGITNDPTPTFTVGTVPAGSQIECSLTGAGQTEVWQDCTSGSYTPRRPGPMARIHLPFAPSRESQRPVTSRSIPFLPQCQPSPPQPPPRSSPAIPCSQPPPSLEVHCAALLIQRRTTASSPAPPASPSP